MTRAGSADKIRKAKRKPKGVIPLRRSRSVTSKKNRNPNTVLAIYPRLWIEEPNSNLTIEDLNDQLYEPVPEEEPKKTRRKNWLAATVLLIAAIVSCVGLYEGIYAPNFNPVIGGLISAFGLVVAVIALIEIIKPNR